MHTGYNPIPIKPSAGLFGSLRVGARHLPSRADDYMQKCALRAVLEGMHTQLIVAAAAPRVDPCLFPS